MKKSLLMIVTIICLVGCDSYGVRQGRKAYKEYFKETLKDPESLKIYKEEIIYSGERDAKFKVDMGAKNSYGAYVRETYCFYTIGNKVAKSGDFMLFKHEAEQIPKPVKLKIKYKVSEYKQYISNSTTVTAFSVGELLTLKTPILAANCGNNYSLLKHDTATNNDGGFNRRFYSGDYKLLPKGTKIIIEAIFDDYYRANYNEPEQEGVNCVKIKIVDGEFKDEIWFISKLLQK